MADFSDLVAYSTHSLYHRSLRSYLTVLGIVIGVAAVVSLISISDGLYASVADQLQAFGARNAYVMAGGTMMQMSGGGYSAPSEGRIFEKDYMRVKNIIGAQYVSRIIVVQQNMEFKRTNLTVSLEGIEPEQFEKMSDFEISDGRFLNGNERSVAVVGPGYADDSIFKSQPMAVGSVFYLGDEKKRFKVVGILDDSNSAGKNTILIPLEDARDLAGESLMDNEITYVGFSVAEGFGMDEVTSNVESDLAASRGVKLDDKDFTVLTAESILEQVGQIIAILSAFLGFITGVSLLVGGVGVANTMYMSVLEKRKEIGTLKAIGASSNDVLLLIVIESAILGLAGGVIGLGAGWLISLIISLFDFKTVVSIPLIIFALTFSVFVGVLSGFLPARDASKLSPIVAMSYE